MKAYSIGDRSHEIDEEDVIISRVRYFKII